MLAVIHASDHVRWQMPFAGRMSQGLKALGVPHRITSSRCRTGDGLAILLGTTFWREVEKDGPYLLVDRCSFGDTDHWVTLVRDGHGRRGDLRVSPGVSGARWERYGVPVAPWRTGHHRVLCGQTETYSPNWRLIFDWYTHVQQRVQVTHFRPHPASANQTLLPEWRTWQDVGLAITLNSSIGVAAVMAGVPTITMDEGAMAWDVTGHDPDDIRVGERTEWLHWLAWTQYTHDEIAEGKPWAHYL